MKTITFDNWRRVPKSFGTRRQWMRRGRKIPPKAEAAARLVFTYEPPGNGPFADEIWLDEPELCLLINQEVPLFHASQTEPVELTPRTRAYLQFEKIFFLFAAKDTFIRWNCEKQNIRNPGELGDWETIHGADRGFLSESLTRRHINQREIIGVHSGPRTRYLAIDHDFHGRDRNVYLDQAEVLVDNFHGSGWHYQVNVDDIDGMHYLRVFDSPRNLQAVRWALRQRLRQLDQEFPDLAARAKAADMKTLGQLEIYPSMTTNFRLPLSRGRQMILDRLLPLVKHRKRSVQDVEEYIRWLHDPNRQYMTKESILTLLWKNLASSRPKITSRAAISATKQAGKDGIGLGKLTGCCRPKLTNFWSGTFNPPKSLNQALIVTARIFFFEGVSEQRAYDLLWAYTSALPPNAHGCSDRLEQGDRKAVDRCITWSVKQAYGGNKGQSEIEMSDAKLRQSVACWQRGGFKLSDTSTWNNCWVRYSTIPDISWTADDELAINAYLAPVLGKKCPVSALIVAQGMVKLAAVKHAQENGMDYSYWQAFLRDEFGVVCGNRNKLHAILQSALELELLDIHCAAIWHADSRKGFATVYCPGKRVADRIIIPTNNTTKLITP